MKKFIIILAGMLLTVSAFAQDSKSIYTKYSDEEGVSAVYISPSMFKMIGKIPSFELSDGESMDISPIVKSLKGFYLLNSSNTSVSEKISSEVRKLLGKGSYELMMEAKDNGDAVRIYTDGDDDVIQSFVMMAMDSAEVTFISMDGMISRKDFEKLINSSIN